MLKKLVIGAVLAAAAMSMVAGDVIAQPRWPPPPGWGRPAPVRPGIRINPGLNIYIGPTIRRPPPRVYVRPPPPVYVRPAPRYCNVPACAATYQSFRAWDCSYQPYYGPRRMCTIP